jgi:DNA-binding transcriptional LysR family regulator
VQLRQLETFLTIVDEGTLTAAARRLYKTQGAVSHDLRLLERNLGVSLIDRTGQRIRLTAAGASLLPHAREVLLRIRDIENAMQRLKQGATDTIRIGSLPSVSSALVDYISRYRKKAPWVHFTVFTDLHKPLIDRLLAGVLDVTVTEPELSSDFQASDLGVEPHVIVMRASQPLAQRSEVSARDLLELPFIGFVRELGSSRVAEQFFTTVGDYPPPVVEVEDYRLMKEFIRREGGYGVMPMSSLRGEQDLVGLKPAPPLKRQLVALRSTKRVSPLAVTSFYDFLVAAWQMQHLIEVVDVPEAV